MGASGGAATEDALLQQALSLSMGGVPLQKDLSQMTEEEQIELAMRMSMQQDAAADDATTAEQKQANEKKPKSRKRKSSALPMIQPSQRKIRLRFDEQNVSPCPVKKALVATKTQIEEVKYDRFKIH